MVPVGSSGSGFPEIAPVALGASHLGPRAAPGLREGEGSWVVQMAFHQVPTTMGMGWWSLGSCKIFLRCPLLLGSVLHVCFVCLNGFFSDQNPFSPCDFHREARQELNDERGRAIWVRENTKSGEVKREDCHRALAFWSDSRQHTDFEADGNQIQGIFEYHHILWPCGHTHEL